MIKLNKKQTTFALTNVHKKTVDTEARSRGISTNALIEELIEEKYESTYPELRAYVGLKHQMNELINKSE